MKRFFSVLITFAVTLISFTASAQSVLPSDPEYRIGKLDNGLTYYIRHNETPKGQADFYIAQKVGSILEEDHQRGLAHFLEHMCFNGTENFPDKNLINWCQSVGIKFGVNLNAYTSWDETVYQVMNVPTARESVQDSCLLILHDWADALTLADEEIDAERGVIHQEWRKDYMGEQKVREQLFPVIMPGNKYAERFPIGTMDVIDNFPYQALRDYYETWYRPDQQAVIVVGDIDVDRIENKIREMFGPIEMPENAKPREYVQVEDTPGTIFAIGSDKEIPTAKFELYFKQNVFPDEYKNTDQYQVFDYIMTMINIMLNNRLSEINATPESPFTNAAAYYTDMYMAKTKDALILMGSAKDDDIRPAFGAAYREVLRAQRGGFTMTEYERAKSTYMAMVEQMYNNRNHVENASFVQACVNHFINSEPLLSIELSWQFLQLLCEQIPVEVINQTMAQLITDDNRVAMIFMPEKEGCIIPTGQQMLDLVSSIDAENIEPYKEEIKDEPLIRTLAKAGKIVKERHNKTWDATEWTLSNGAKVIVKPTDLKDDEILFTAHSNGGTNSLDDSYIHDIKFLSYALGRHGLGTYDNMDIRKYLAGKMVSLSYSINENNRSIDGSTTPKDLPALMELIYAAFTDFTLTEEDFKSTKSTYESIIPNQESNPQYVFSKALTNSLYDNQRNHLLTIEDIKASSKENIMHIVSSMTANASDFTFVFVGNIDSETLRPLVETYIASLPSSKKSSVKVKELPGMEVRKGTETHTHTMKMETPQTYVYFDRSMELPYTMKNILLAQIAGTVLGNHLISTVREEMGAVYSIGAQGYMNSQGKLNTHIISGFPMKPEMKDEVISFIEEDMKNMETSVTDEEVREAVEYLIKQHNENSESNGYLIDGIYQWLQTGQDLRTDRIKVLNSITATDIRNFMKQLNTAGNWQVVTLEPNDSICGL